MSKKRNGASDLFVLLLFAGLALWLWSLAGSK